jgi:beta-galactosidase
MGAEIEKAGNQIEGSEVRSSVAMVLSYDTRFAFQIQPNNPRFSYPEHFHQLYRAFFRQHVSIDIVEPNADLSTYKLVIAPALHLLNQAGAENLKHFVQAGGNLVVTQRAGVKDESNAVVNQRLPGLLAELCGVEVEEYDSLSSDMQNGLEFVVPELAGTTKPAIGILCDILKPTSATVVARYTQDFYSGKPAITLNSFGKGWALYIGALGDGQLYEPLAGWLLARNGLKPILAVPDGVEVTERWRGARRLLFVLNHLGQSEIIILDKRYTNLLDGRELLGEIQIEPKGVLILA